MSHLGIDLNDMSEAERHSEGPEGLTHWGRTLSLPGTEFESSNLIPVLQTLEYGQHLRENGINVSKYDMTYADEQHKISDAVVNENPAVDKGDGWYSLMYSGDGTNSFDSARITAAEYKVEFDADGNVPTALGFAYGSMRSREPKDYLKDGVPKDGNDYEHWKEDAAETGMTFSNEDVAYEAYANEAARNQRVITVDCNDPAEMNPQLLEGMKSYDIPGVSKVERAPGFLGRDSADLLYSDPSAAPYIDKAVETGNPAVDKGDGWYSWVYMGTDDHCIKDACLDTAEYKVGEDDALHMRSTSSYDYLSWSSLGKKIPQDAADYDNWVDEQKKAGVTDEEQLSLDNYSEAAAENQREITVNMFDNNLNPDFVNGMREHYAQAEMDAANPMRLMPIEKRDNTLQDTEEKTKATENAFASGSVQAGLNGFTQDLKSLFNVMQSTLAVNTAVTSVFEGKESQEQRIKADTSKIDASKGMSQEQQFFA